MTIVNHVSGCVTRGVSNLPSSRSWQPHSAGRVVCLHECVLPRGMCRNRIVQELLEDVIWASAHGSCSKLFLFNKWILFFIFEGCGLCLCFHFFFFFFMSLRSPYLILRQNVSSLFHRVHDWGRRVNSRTTYGIESPTEKGQVANFLLDSPAVPVCSSHRLCEYWRAAHTRGDA